MTNFRTEFPLFDYPFKINHQSQSLCIGSCFAEHIGNRLLKYQFPSLVNPFGILYNPVVIANQLQRTMENTFYKKKELFQHQDLWHHFLFHSQFSNSQPEQALAKMNEQLSLTDSFLSKSNLLILTLGTARVFINKADQQIVANCHKLPGNHFEKKLLSVSDCVRSLSTVFEKLKATNPTLNIILTVSPVRHIRDGLVENQLSKSTLLLSCAELRQQYDYIHYFPSWEIMMDDLRDYRYYGKDMIHPSELAVDYIWSFFKNSLFSKETVELTSQIDKVIQACTHRPFQQDTPGHQRFLQKQLNEIATLEQSSSFLKFEKEKKLLKSQLLD